METLRLERPDANETEEDLIRMQNEMLKKKCKKRSSVPNRKNFFAEKIRQIDKRAGRFYLDLDSLAENENNIMELTVQERNVDLLYNLDQQRDCSNPAKCEEYAEEEGFPDVLDLSRYYNGLDSAVKDIPADGRSFFALEFDRIHGRNTDYEVAEASTSVAEKPMNDISQEMEVENLQRIERMSKYEIEKAKQEIMERFDQKLLDFLRSRAKNGRQVKTKQIEQKPQQIEKSSGATAGAAANVCAATNTEVTDRVKELEIFDFNEKNSTLHEDSASELNDPYIRLATDAAQLDMATKCMRTIMPRQQKNIVKLFDNLRIPPKNYDGDDALLEKARANLNAIKGLYLQERKDKDGNISVLFANGINPFGKPAWMLSPIRNVLDVIQKDGKPTAHDLVIVRLSLFWTLLVLIERPTLYYAFATPSEIFIRLAEIFMMGPEIFKDECVSQCVSRFFHKYLKPKSCAGLLCLVLSEPIAELDSFRVFYEDLLHHFEEFSMGDENFTLFILLCAYANQRHLDGLLMKLAIWAPDKNIVRQMVLRKDSGEFLLTMLTARQMDDDCDATAKKYFSNFRNLFLIYAAVIRDGIIVKDRNELVYEIASSELKHYIKWYRAKNVHEDTEVMRLHDSLVQTLRKSLAGHIDFELK